MGVGGGPGGQEEPLFPGCFTVSGPSRFPWNVGVSACLSVPVSGTCEDVGGLPRGVQTVAPLARPSPDPWAALRADSPHL